jgi:hypothetical protein
MQNVTCTQLHISYTCNRIREEKSEMAGGKTWLSVKTAV